MRKYLARLALACCLFLLAACSSTRTSSTATPTRAGAPAPGSASVYYSVPASSGRQAINALDGSTGKLRWNYAASANGADSTQLVLAEGVLFLATNASLIALNVSTGKLLWNTPVPRDTGIVGEEGGILYAETFSIGSGPLQSSLVALNASTGKPRWSYQLHYGGENLLADGVLYSSDTLSPYGTPTSPNGSFLLAFNASDGSLRWKSAQESGYLTPISAAGGLLYADNSFPMGGPEIIEARRSSDGSLAWRFPSGSGHATYLGLENNTLYVMRNDSSAGNSTITLYALNATTGVVLWQKEVNPSVQLFAELSPQAVYVGDGADNSLTALSAAVGKQLWQTKLGTPSGDANAVVTAAAEVDGTVYLSYSGGFAALDANTGAIRWEAQDPLTQDLGGHPILAVRGGILFSRSNTRVVAHSIQDGRLVWSQDVGLQNDPIIG